MRFDDFVKKATGIPAGPFPFQRAFAEADELPRLVRVPTGLGKTAMAVLGWLWRRQSAPEQTPRRLVYCLPMRVLVEQTQESVQKWLEKLELSHQVGVHLLMGGEKADDWDLYPERQAVLIGTQDMLLSRALNRGYGMSRYRWPIQFGLLHSDALWIFDEVQLMDAGVATSSQLEAFRKDCGVFGRTDCTWMSATLNQAWLDTVDFDLDWLGEPLGLSAEDLHIEAVASRFQSFKPLGRSPIRMGEEEAAAETIAQAHQPGSLTLGIFNTVERAVNVYFALRKKASARAVLIHSRFRPPERREKLQELLATPGEEGLIAISTQVVEAGVDVSAKILFTELAPWASLVQRFGRCNRRGEFNSSKDAGIHWFDWPEGADEKAIEKLSAPYRSEELSAARELLASHSNAASASLKDAPMDLAASHVLRRRDFVDLFDTTPDLAGNDIDVSRFIRSGQDLDVQVFWRSLPKDVRAPEPDQQHGRAPHRDELCPLPFYLLADFVKKKGRGHMWRWDRLERRWRPASSSPVYPGQRFLIRSEAGAYDDETGWNPAAKGPVPLVQVETVENESYQDDAGSMAEWQTIAEHTQEVVDHLVELSRGLPLNGACRQALGTAARWHDRGKGHEAFQGAVRGLEEGTGGSEQLRPAAYSNRIDIAKAPPSFWKRKQRPLFRHELASALAMLQAGLPDLAVYLAAAHHGKVRLSIRSLPGEKTPEDAELLFARGVWEGDSLAEVDLGSGEIAPSAKLSLECMLLGRSEGGEPSWAERMLQLRDLHGPFRMAYLEALLRAADMRASRNPQATQSTGGAA